MFTRISNFTYGNYQIANIKADALNENILFNIHLQKFEKECLKMVLGEELCTDMLANVELDSSGYYTLKSTANAKWSRLINGHSFTNTIDLCNCESGKTVKWDGFNTVVAKIGTTEILESIFAPFIYYHWSLNERTHDTGIGEVKLNAKIGTQTTSSNKRVDAWNEFCKKIYFGNSCSNVSLMNFFENFKDDYPNYPNLILKPLTYYDL